MRRAPTPIPPPTSLWGRERTVGQDSEAWSAREPKSVGVPTTDEDGMATGAG